MHPSIQQILIKQLLCANHTVTDWAGRRGKGGNTDGWSLCSSQDPVRSSGTTLVIQEGIYYRK